MSPLLYTHAWFGTDWYEMEPAITRQGLAGLQTWFSRRIASLADHGGPDDKNPACRYPLC